MKLLVILFIGLYFFTIGSTANAQFDDISGRVTLPNPLQTAEPNILIGQIINAVMGIIGSLALVMFIYGGLTWMLAAGNNEKVQKGKNILVWATIGLVVIFSSYALVRFVFTGLGA
jgi:hypothetical protein